MHHSHSNNVCSTPWGPSTSSVCGASCIHQQECVQRYLGPLSWRLRRVGDRPKRQLVDYWVRGAALTSREAQIARVPTAALYQEHRCCSTLQHVIPAAPPCRLLVSALRSIHHHPVQADNLFCGDHIYSSAPGGRSAGGLAEAGYHHHQLHGIQGFWRCL